MTTRSKSFPWPFPPQYMANSWFPHDSTASTDSKLLRLRQKYGWEGYGIYFAILEWMWQSADAKMPESDIEVLGTLLGKRSDFVRHLVDFCEVIGLFQKVAGNYLSERLVSEKQKEIEKSAKARQSAENRWRKNCAKVMRTHSEGNAPPTHHTHHIDTTYLSSHANELEKLSERVALVFGSPKKITDAAKDKWRVRRKSYSAEELYRAFENLLNEPDHWKLTHNGSRPLAWWLHSDERIEEMLSCHLKNSLQQNA